MTPYLPREPTALQSEKKKKKNKNLSPREVCSNKNHKVMKHRTWTTEMFWFQIQTLEIYFILLRI